MQGQSLRRIVPAPSPGCTHPAHPQVASGPLRTERDLTDITVESGRAWGKPAAVPAGLGAAAQGLCFSVGGGGQQGLGRPCPAPGGTGVRPGRGGSSPGRCPSEQQARTPSSSSPWPLASAREPVIRALMGAGRAAGPRHFIACLRSGLLGDCTGARPWSTPSHHPEAEPTSKD